MTKLFKGMFLQDGEVSQQSSTTGKILIISNPSFLYKKDVRNETKDGEISDVLLNYVAANYSHVIVLNTPFWTLDTDHEELLRTQFRFGVMTIDGKNIAESVKCVLDHLVSEFSVKMSKKPNRTVSWLRLQDCIADARVHVVGSHPEDYEKIGTKPDKDVSFDELNRIRVKKFVI